MSVPEDDRVVVEEVEEGWEGVGVEITLSMAWAAWVKVGDGQRSP